MAAAAPCAGVLITATSVPDPAEDPATHHQLTDPAADHPCLAPDPAAVQVVVQICTASRYTSLKKQRHGLHRAFAFFDYPCARSPIHALTVGATNRPTVAPSICTRIPLTPLAAPRCTAV